MKYEVAMFASDFCFVVFFILYLIFKSHVKFLRANSGGDPEAVRRIAAKSGWTRVFFWLWVLSFIAMVVSIFLGFKYT